MAEFEVTWRQVQYSEQERYSRYAGRYADSCGKITDKAEDTQNRTECYKIQDLSIKSIPE